VTGRLCAVRCGAVRCGVQCKDVQGLMAGLVAGLAAGDWKEKACSCLGCCEESPGDECYYPVVYGTNDEAHAAHKF
jgi:hypothetical protein